VALSLPSELPEGVEQAYLYDGPKPVENVVAMPPPPKPQPILPAPEPQRGLSPTAQTKIEYSALLVEAFAHMLSVRLMGLIAVVAACGIWSFAVWDPNPVRTIAAGLFSVTVLGPIVALYWKAGITGGGA
jgi:hypothetical protein